MKIEFKHEYFGDDWEDWRSEFGDEPYSEEYAAEKIAEYIYESDPIDANDFDETVEIRSKNGVKKFSITAEYSVDFYAQEIK